MNRSFFSERNCKLGNYHASLYAGKRKVDLILTAITMETLAEESGKVVEINQFGSFKDANQVFDEIKGDHGYELKLQISLG